MSHTEKVTANANTPNTNTATTNTGFEFFKGHVSENKKTPKITVRRGGLMVLNAGAVERLGQGVTHVQLAYNAERRAVGVKAAGESDEGSYLLGKGQNDRQRKIHGRRFFSHYELATEKARSYPVEDFGGGILGFQLSEAEPEPALAAPKVDAKPAAERRKGGAKA